VAGFTRYLHDYLAFTFSFCKKVILLHFIKHIMFRHDDFINIYKIMARSIWQHFEPSENSNLYFGSSSLRMFFNELFVYIHVLSHSEEEEEDEEEEEEEEEEAAFSSSFFQHGLGGVVTGTEVTELDKNCQYLYPREFCELCEKPTRHGRHQ